MRLWSLCVVLALLPLPGLAFKIDTHVWVGQQVLNDVIPDGRVTVNQREYAVPPHVWQALKDYASVYRMGHVGPDLLPDVMAGQMSVHPGVPGGWDTGDWLRWVTADQSSPERTAFAFGYLGHAAADVMSHSYVNSYAGDVFMLMDDGEAMEQEVELRHFALESYIATHTPPLRDHLGNALGPASGLVTTPAGFLASRLILNSDVRHQYEQQLFTAYLGAMHSLREAVGKAHENVANMDGVVIPQQMARLLGLRLGFEKQLAALGAEAERLQNDIAVKGSQANVHLQQINGLRTLVEQNRVLIESLTSVIGQLGTELANRNAIVSDLQTQLANTVKNTCSRVCKNLPPGCGGWPRPPCAPFCEDICELAAAWVDLNNRLTQAIANRDATLADLTSRVAARAAAEANQASYQATMAVLESQRQVLLEQIALATDLLAQAQASWEQARTDLLAVLDEVAETQRVQNLFVVVLRTMLEHWHRDLGLAVEAYVVAWGDVSKRLMDGTGDPAQPMFGPNGSVTNGVGDGALVPLTSWVGCWAPVFQGVPKELPNAACRVKQSIDVVLSALNDLKANLGALGWLVDPAAQLEAIVLQEVEPTLVSTSMEIATKVGGPQMLDLIRLFYFGATAQTLDGVFATDSSGKRLVLIPDVSGRVNADMKMTPEGWFDPERYRVARNAVVLAKLALLEPATLNALARDLAPTLATTAYGPTLYPVSSTATPVNVLDFVSSIDGNQQWQQLALPYPRRGTTVDPQWPWQGPLTTPSPRSYSHGFEGGSDGFRFWEDATLRGLSFGGQDAALFQGPLAPGIEYPQEHGLTTLLPKSYPFKACPQNPFPRTTNLDGTFLTDALGARRDPGCDGDLVVVSVVRMLDSRRLMLGITVTNVGAEKAVSSAVAVYLSADALLDASDTLLGQPSIGGLAPGASVSRTVNARLKDLPTGSFYAIAVVDPAGQVAEARETNNQAALPVTIP